MIIDEIRAELKCLQDMKYREMQIRIIPTVKPESIIGVRTPELRQMAKRYNDCTLVSIIGETHHFDRHPDRMKEAIREWMKVRVESGE